LSDCFFQIVNLVLFFYKEQKVHFHVMQLNCLKSPSETVKCRTLSSLITPLMLRC
jgi:hypothetical protein